MNQKLLPLFVVIALFVTTLSSCEKDDPTPSPGQPISMTAKIDSVAWASQFKSLSAGIFNNSSFFAGMAADSSEIKIEISQKVELNQTYSLSFMSGNFASYSKNGTIWVNSNTLNTGSITITSINPITRRVSAIFNFNAYSFSNNTFVNVTDGVISNVRYQVPVTSTGNTLTVKVDNVPFDPTVIEGYDDSVELTVYGTDALGERGVGITMPSSIMPGTYTITDPISSPIYAIYQHDASIVTFATTGTLVITSNNVSINKIEGTFHFMSDQFGSPPVFDLTDGVFSVSY